MADPSERSRSARSLWLLVALAAGCGTVLDSVSPHEAGPRPYGGVRLDASLLASGGLGLGPLLVLDLPLSAALDTLLLPLTIPLALLADEPEDRAGP